MERFGAKWSKLYLAVINSSKQNQIQPIAHIYKNKAGVTLLNCHLPHGVLHMVVAQLMIVQLSKEWKEHLDSTNGMNGTVDGVSQSSFHILWEALKQSENLSGCETKLSQRVMNWHNAHKVRLRIEGTWPAAWGRAASAQRWRRFPSARSPGRAERRWPWRYRWKQWSWPTCCHITPVCDARLNRCRSQI